MSGFFEKFRRDIIGIAWLATSLFMGLALFSFKPTDPSFNSTGVGLQVHNYCGYIGSFAADLIYQGLGLSAWILVLAGLRVGIQSFREEESEWPGVRVFFGGLTVLTTASLLGLYFANARMYDHHISLGGFVGGIVANGLVSAFNSMGASILLWSVSLLLIVFYTEKPLKEIFKSPLAILSHLMSHLSEQVSIRTAAFRRLFEFNGLRPQMSGVAIDAGVAQSQSPLKKIGLGMIPLGKTKRTSSDSMEPSLKNPSSVNAKGGALGGTSENAPENAPENARGTKVTRANLSQSTESEMSRQLHLKAHNSAHGTVSDAVNDAVSDAVNDSENGDDSSGQSAADFAEAGEDSTQTAAKAEIKVGQAGEVPRRRVKLNAKVDRRVENWKLPDIHLLEDPPVSRIRLDDKEIQKRAQTLTDKLSQFSVRGEVVHAKPGPAVTMYEFKPAADVKISRITELADDLSLALSSESVRIIAPIPGRDVVGIETSNSQREIVYLKDILANDQFWNESMKLPLCLGRQADGESKVVDLRKMPHLMVAGTTGSGKSVFVVSAITGLLFKHSPKTLRLILIDPKQVDLASFNDIPHLLMPPIREPKKAVSALKWAIREMDKRYRSMSRFGARGLESYNEIVGKLSKEQVEQHEATNTEWEVDARRLEQYYFSPQPYIVIVVEEFGDLMAVDKANVENLVVRLAQMARACGIHLVLAMQSPRKDVVTGLIKTNIPGRITFKVASKMDSRIILDESGGERLLPNGDMLYLAPGVSKPQRHHAPWVTEAEIAAVMRSWSEQGEPQYDIFAMRALEGSGGGFDLGGGGEDGGDGFGGDGDENEYDERYDEILAYVSSLKEVSASLLQRRFKLGYPRAARMIELFEREKVVGPANGSKPRPVLIAAFKDA